MKSTLDPEWRDLMKDWQAEERTAPPTPPLSEEVRRRIRRKARLHSYGLIAIAAGEALTIVGVLGFLLLETLEKPEPVRIVGLAGTALFFAFALVFTLRNRRGTWWHSGETTRDFVELSYVRCQRKLRTLRACPRLLAAEMLFLLPWATWALLARPEPAPLSKWLAVFGWTALTVAAVLAWSAWYGRRVRRELTELEELRRSLVE